MSENLAEDSKHAHLIDVPEFWVSSVSGGLTGAYNAILVCMRSTPMMDDRTNVLSSADAQAPVVVLQMSVGSLKNLSIVTKLLVESAETALGTVIETSYTKQLAEETKLLVN